MENVVARLLSDRYAVSALVLFASAGTTVPVPDKLSRFLETPAAEFLQMWVLLFLWTRDPVASLLASAVWQLAVRALAQPRIDDGSLPAPRGMHTSVDVDARGNPIVRDGGYGGVVNL